MDEDFLEITDDHNHNHCEDPGTLFHLNSRSDQPGGARCCTPAGGGVGVAGFGGGVVGVGGESGPWSGRVEQVGAAGSVSEFGPAEGSEGSEPSSGRLILNSPSKFLMNVMTAEDYRTNYWPKLERAVEHLLTQSPVDHISISYEQIYSHVYKCVCQQHSELLYNDLIWKIVSHLQRVSSELQESPPESFIEKFNLALTQYTAALQCIVPVFIYMNRFYIETKLNRDLKDDLMKLFSDHVAEKHVNTLIPLLIKAEAVPFQVRPSTMASVVKGLYALRPDWAPLAPALFSRFIPQVQPPALESQLPQYAVQDQNLQIELSLNGFSRGDQSRKRASEES
ncbi:CDK2-associated and cullin domain-containing protein 1 [Astyanax mexicanus]|uniref:CDK2-associated and cullin domain-containing protein 1 n=2 Tax=Astyanax mexicanus TaxID=7994 RepID=A0A8T2LSE6_ASTMX|nr:CDK2-associated and cullin domain-containing protein 1 [Astyanax mexicanus]